MRCLCNESYVTTSEHAFAPQDMLFMLDSLSLHERPQLGIAFMSPDPLAKVTPRLTHCTILELYHLSS